MNCADCEELMYTYWESTPEQQKLVQDHLRTCATCSEKFDHLLQQQSLMITLSGSVHKIDDESILTGKIMEAVYREKITAVKQGVTTQRYIFFHALRYAAAVVSLFLVGLFAYEFAMPTGLRTKITEDTTTIARGKETRLVTAGFISARNTKARESEQTSLKEMAYCAIQLHTSSQEQSCASCKKCNKNLSR